MYRHLIGLVIFTIFFNGLLSAQTDDEQFNSFFQNFKSAVSNNNIDEIIKLTNFPFIWTWGNMEKQISKDEFTTNPYMPDYNSLSKLKFNKTVILSKDKYEVETVYFGYENGYYLIGCGIENTDENWISYSNYYFSVINGEYKYIKCVAGD